MNAPLTFDGDDNTLVGLLIPFGGKDLHGETFTAQPDLMLGMIEGPRPLLWHHGLDPEVKGEVVGRITQLVLHDSGIWVRAQLDMAGQYAARIRQLVKSGVVGLSSGALAHMVKRDADGYIQIWPLVEGSLTVTPAHPNAHAYSVKSADARRHFEALGRLTPVSRDELRSIRYSLTNGAAPYTGLVVGGVDGVFVMQPTTETRHAP